MKFSTIVLAVAIPAVQAFAPLSFGSTQRSQLSMIATSTIYTSEAESMARDNVVNVAKSLKLEHGVFVIDQQAKQRIENAVMELERSTMPPTNEKVEELVGDWTLISTTASKMQGVDTSIFPDPIQQLRNTVTNAANKYISVEQRIKKNTSTGMIDRIDHVIEYMPPDSLKDIISNVPAQLSSLNINPLDVSKSTLCLIHKASVDLSARTPPLLTKLSLQSIVLNVAGQSQMLSPDGKDIAGINLPSQISDFANGGDFETTYIDDTLRISRGKRGGNNNALAQQFTDQLRVFIRKDKLVNLQAKEEVIKSEISKNIDLGDGPSAEVDVDAAVDPEFDNKNSAKTDQMDIADEDI